MSGEGGASFGASATLALEVPDSELRKVRGQVEDIGPVAVSVENGQARPGGLTDGGGALGSTDVSALVELSNEQLDVQEEILDELQADVGGGLVSGTSSAGILAGLGGAGAAGIAGTLGLASAVALGGGAIGKGAQNVLKGQFPDAFADSENVVPGTSVTIGDDAEAVLSDLSVPEPSWIDDLSLPEPDWLPDPPSTGDSSSTSARNRPDPSSGDSSESTTPREGGDARLAAAAEAATSVRDRPTLTESFTPRNRAAEGGDARLATLAVGRNRPDRQGGDARLETIARNRTEIDSQGGDIRLNVEANVQVDQNGVSQRELERKIDEATEEAKKQAKEEVRRELVGGRTGI